MMASTRSLYRACVFAAGSPPMAEAAAFLIWSRNASHRRPAPRPALRAGAAAVAVLGTRAAPRAAWRAVREVADATADAADMAILGRAEIRHGRDG